LASLGHPANFNGLCLLAVLLHRFLVAKLCVVEQRAPPISGRAAITLGIGPHSSFCILSYCIFVVSELVNSCCNLFYKYSAVAEMGEGLAPMDMGRKLGAVRILGELDPHVTHCGVG